LVAIILLASIVLAACGPTATPTPAAASIKVGEVSDFGGVTDMSFNQAAWEGLQKAGTDFGVDYKFLKSDVQADYAKNIQQFLSEGNDLIVTVGFNMGVDTAIAAKANPDQKFAIVDYSFPDCWPGAVEGKDCGSATDLTNVRGLMFQTDQAAFLAGYVAAAYTKTGKVATYGGLPFPTVTIFMKGFEAGVKYYNEKHGTAVEVLGWNTAEPDKGTFVNNFDSTDDGRRMAESFMQEGADVILPVAGGVGLGSAQVCQETKACVVIGVDSDWVLTDPDHKDVWLTSVLKRVDVAVYSSVKDVAEGTFIGGTVTYTIADGGVDIAPFHEFESKISDDIKAELAEIKKGLIDGTLTVDGVLGIAK
jgi:basic membrane protein A